MKNKKAQEIHQEAYDEITAFLQSKSPEKGLLTGRTFEIISSLSQEDFKLLSDICFRYYDKWQQSFEKDSYLSTHAIISRCALDILTQLGCGLNSDTDAQIQNESDGPDRVLSENYLLLFSGHFCHRSKDGGYVNYLGQHDTAMSRFLKHYGEYMVKPSLDKGKYLAWSLHYLQDLTAPHHAGNYPAILSGIEYGFDTHEDFEGKARELVNTDFSIRALYMDTATSLMPELEQWYSVGMNVFCENIYGRSEPDENDIAIIKQDADSNNQWKMIYDRQLPLAIAASAVVLKHSPL